MASAPIATEAQILSSFLLSRASLKSIISLRHFIELFPKDKRSNPQIKLLYRELELVRNRQCAIIKKRIQQEALQGARHRRDAADARKREQAPDQDTMVGIELFGAPPAQPILPLKELLKQMSLAADDLDSRQTTLDSECDEIMAYIRSIVGDLSDLRYGKLADPSTDEKVTREINHLVEVCERALNSENELLNGNNIS